MITQSESQNMHGMVYKSANTDKKYPSTSVGVEWHYHRKERILIKLNSKLTLYEKYFYRYDRACISIIIILATCLFN